MKKRKLQPIIFVMCAIKDGKLLTETIVTEDEQRGDKDWAISQFMQKHEMEPGWVSIALKEFKNSTIDSASKNVVSLDAKELRYTRNRYSGVWQGWSFEGNGIRAIDTDQGCFDDDDLIAPIFDKCVKKGSRKPALRRNSCIPAVEVEDLQIVED